MAEPFIGQLEMFGFNFAPRNWALCDGQTVPVASHPALAAIIGNIYGGEGSTPVGLPDLRGRVPLHVGYDVNQAQLLGLPELTLTPMTAPTHAHTLETVEVEGSALAGNGRMISQADVPASLPFGPPENRVAMNAGMLA